MNNNEKNSFLNHDLESFANMDFDSITKAISYLESIQNKLKQELITSIENYDTESYQRIIDKFPNLLKKDTQFIEKSILTAQTKDFPFLENLFSHMFFQQVVGKLLKRQAITNLVSHNLNNKILLKEIEKASFYENGILEQAINNSIKEGTFVEIDTELYIEHIKKNNLSVPINDLKKILSSDYHDKLQFIIDNNLIALLNKSEELQTNLLSVALSSFSNNNIKFLLDKYKDNATYQQICMSDVLDLYDKGKQHYLLKSEERFKEYRKICFNNFFIDPDFLLTFPFILGQSPDSNVWYEFVDVVIQKNDREMLKQLVLGIDKSPNKEFKKQTKAICNKALQYFKFEKNLSQKEENPIIERKTKI